MSDAYQDGVRLLSRRALTRHEVVLRLRARGHDEADVTAAVTRLQEHAAIDDRSVARQWIESQAATRGRGRERALAALVARGIDEAIASSAWSEAVEDGVLNDTDLVARAVRRRLGPPPGTAGRERLLRVYNALLHEGFEPQPLEAALAPYGFERIDP